MIEIGFLPVDVENVKDGRLYWAKCDKCGEKFFAYDTTSLFLSRESLRKALTINGWEARETGNTICRECLVPTSKPSSRTAMEKIIEEVKQEMRDEQSIEKAIKDVIKEGWMLVPKETRGTHISTVGAMLDRQERKLEEIKQMIAELKKTKKG